MPKKKTLWFGWSAEYPEDGSVCVTAPDRPRARREVAKALGYNRLSDVAVQLVTVDVLCGFQDTIENLMHQKSILHRAVMLATAELDSDPKAARKRLMDAAQANADAEEAAEKAKRAEKARR
jgi:hypothetical protein